MSTNHLSFFRFSNRFPPKIKNTQKNTIFLLFFFFSFAVADLKMTKLINKTTKEIAK